MRNFTIIHFKVFNGFHAMALKDSCTSFSEIRGAQPTLKFLPKTVQGLKLLPGVDTKSHF